jgi:hypothetical protein
MNAKLNPVMSAIIIVIAIAAVFGIMWSAANKREPHMPTGMGGAMKGGPGQNRGPTGPGAAAQGGD